jgi:hypothetical protein
MIGRAGQFRDRIGERTVGGKGPVLDQERYFVVSIRKAKRALFIVANEVDAGEPGIDERGL